MTFTVSFLHGCTHHDIIITNVVISIPDRVSLGGLVNTTAC